MTAILVGARGGIGAALCAAILARARPADLPLLAFARTPPDPAPGLLPARLDVTDEGSIAAAAALAARHAPPRLVVVATGTLLGPNGEGPERALRALDAGHLLHAMRVNAVGPALVAKHLLPLLPREGRSTFAALSARVGSITDNRLGGWHGYRASKAALDMLLRCLQIELSRTHPEALVVGLHPGTVDTPLSRPFQRGVPPGRLFSPADAAAHLLAVLDALRPEHGGCVLDWAGAVVPP